jgi:integrase
VRKDFALLRAAFGAAIADEQFSLTVNPLDGVRVPVDSETRKPREAFTVEELQRLFDLPVFVAGARPKAGAGEAAFWLPLLALFTGARRGELAQLRYDDMQTRDGVRCIALRHDALRGQQIKTRERGSRVVPLHPELERLGFLRYVEAVHGRGWLFPMLEHSAAGDRAKSYGKWFARLMDEAGLTDTRLDFHSFRHTWKHFARASGIAEDQADAITGHSGGSRVARSYGSKAGYPIVRLATAMAQFRIDGLNLSRLKGV